MKIIFLTFFLCLLLIETVYPKPLISSNLVISQVYGDGGTNGATYRNDFIEIYNAGGAPVNLSGYSVQYASGTTWTMTALTAVVLQPGQYYLIKQASNGGNGAELPAADQTGTISLHSNNGKVALVNSTSVLPNGCSSSSIIDLVGYGNANCYEAASATGGTNISSIIRKAGNTDTDNNSVDFTNALPNPRTTSFTLPITINNFSVNKHGKTNYLHWLLNCTAASLTFELQRSVNGLSFYSIHTEIASQSRCAAPFKIADRKPLEVNYYRLKITDPDNNISYSKIVFMANNVSSQVLTLHPTRVSANANIQYVSPGDNTIKWVITNIEGKTLKKITSSVISGENNIQLNTFYLPKGQYQLQGYTVQGNTNVVKFVKE